MFPDFDDGHFYIRGKFTDTHTAQEVKNKTDKIQEILQKLDKKWGIKNNSLDTGYRINNQGRSERKPSVFEFKIELDDRIAQNIVDAYITPILSFDTDNKNNTREKSLDEVMIHLRKLFKSYKPEGLEEFTLQRDGAGITSNDIEI